MAMSDLEKFVDDSVALGMKHIFSQPEIQDLDKADGLKQILCEKKYDLGYFLQSDAALVAGELGIEKYQHHRFPLALDILPANEKFFICS